MKFSLVALLSLAAFTQADVIDDISSAFNSASALGHSIASEISQDADGLKSRISTEINQITSDFGEITSSLGAAITSAEVAFSTATDSALKASISSDLARFTSQFASATSNAQSALNSATSTSTSSGAGVPGVMPTAAVAVGALFGGAAVAMNF